MCDRQVFETDTLGNGMTVNYYHTDQPFIHFTVYIPIGSSYSSEAHPQGLPHFYEHMTFHRSEAFPEKDSFSKWVSSKGGEVNAITRPFCTTYTLEIPTQFANEAWNGLYHLLFHPLFTEADIEIERTIIANERDQRKWYPAENEIGYHLSTKWLDSRHIEKDQLFGSDADLARITPEILSEFTKGYSHKGLQVFVTGPEKIESVANTLATITTRGGDIPERYIHLTWKHPDFHTHEFADIDKPVYFLGSLFALSTDQERAAIHFLLEYLTDFSTGPLHQWLRHDLGWTYGVSYEWIINKSEEVVVFEIPLQSTEQVEIVRRELFERIIQSLNNKEILENELERQLGKRVFFYQKTSEVIDDAINDLIKYGSVTSETAYVTNLKRCTDPEYITHIYQKFFNPEQRGEFCALPKE